MNDPYSSQFLFVWIFNVGRGVAAFARTPENYGLNVDCADGEESPLQRVTKVVIPKLRQYEGRKVAQAVISHPHTDHYRDIYTMVAWNPNLITCPNDKDPPNGYRDERFNFELLETKEPLLKVYKECYSERNLPLQVPMLGSTIPGFYYSIFYVRPPVVEADLPAVDYVNNCSIMVWLRYGNSSVLLPGDMMSSGMEHVIDVGGESRQTGSGVPDAGRLRTIDPLLFRHLVEARGCDFLVAPHHGLTSAWPAALFDLLSRNDHRVRMSVISEMASPGDNAGQVDSRYSSADYVKGHDVFYDDGTSETRRSVTTRCDGHILLALHQSQRPVVVVSQSLDWILKHAPQAIVAGQMRKAVLV